MGGMVDLAESMVGEDGSLLADDDQGAAAVPPGRQHRHQGSRGMQILQAVTPTRQSSEWTSK